MTEFEPIAPSEFQHADGVADWRVLSDGANIYFPTASLAESARLVQAIAEIPGIDQHPPAIDIREGGVTVRLITFTESFAGLTERDRDIARQISAAAASFGLTADPAGVQSLLIVPGAPDIDVVTPFWRAALGYQPRIDSPREDLVDPRDRNTPFWFETMEEPHPGEGGAIHVAVWVPEEEAEGRVKAALAAGGHVVRDVAPSWWTLADAAGNEIDISTIAGRG
ncbi:MAG TPA: VOC family protein [Candidatus Limnocylindria bacterium]|nr:VOC family protein [Candidatus Limnocylindria bacterium]